MGAYAGLSNKDFFELAMRIPDRNEVQSWHEYVRTVRELVNGEDVISVPATHRKLLNNNENHEGSNRLNSRIRQLASWFSAAEPRFKVAAASPDPDVRHAAARMERFARRGEKRLAAGRGLHNWRQELHRDLAEVGACILQQHPLRDYYVEIEPTPQRMAEGALLTDVIWRQRVDPETFGWEEDGKGGFGVTAIRSMRSLSELVTLYSSEAAEKAATMFTWGQGFSADDSATWQPSKLIEVAEVWGEDKGALVIIGGEGHQANFPRLSSSRVVAKWNNLVGKPPHYIAAPGTWPWHSPLDEMVQLTALRNYWATMRDAQAAGAIFRNWQLIDVKTGQNAMDTLDPGEVPEHILYDMTKPPPHFEGKQWVLAPFELLDVDVRHAAIVAQHESAGASVARLMGQQIGQYAAVGTVDAMAEDARREFGDWTDAIGEMLTAAWLDLFKWLRVHHKDPLVVFDRQRDTDSEYEFVDVELALKASDIVTEHLEVAPDTRNRLAKLADFRAAVESIVGGFSDYRTEVEKGRIDVDDADEEIMSMYISEMERIEANLELQAYAAQRQHELFGAPAPPPPPNADQQPRLLKGMRTDPRSLGTEQGPSNISNSALDAGASDLARSA